MEADDYPRHCLREIRNSDFAGLIRVLSHVSCRSSARRIPPDRRVTRAFQLFHEPANLHNGSGSLGSLSFPPLIIYRRQSVKAHRPQIAARARARASSHSSIRWNPIRCVFSTIVSCRSICFLSSSVDGKTCARAPPLPSGGKGGRRPRRACIARCN